MSDRSSQTRRFFSLWSEPIKPTSTNCFLKMSFFPLCIWVTKRNSSLLYMKTIWLTLYFIMLSTRNRMKKQSMQLERLLTWAIMLILRLETMIRRLFLLLKSCFKRKKRSRYNFCIWSKDLQRGKDQILSWMYEWLELL